MKMIKPALLLLAACVLLFSGFALFGAAGEWIGGMESWLAFGVMPFVFIVCMALIAGGGACFIVALSLASDEES